MPKPQFGKTRHKSLLEEISDESELCTRLLERLVDNDLTKLERTKIAAQLSLANNRIKEKIRELKQIRENAGGGT